MASVDNDSSEKTRDDRSQEAVLRQIADALRGLKFGVLSIIVQDGVVVQLDRTEKRRLRQKDSRS